MNTYTKGTKIKLKATFYDEDGELFDPQVVRFKVRAPGVDPDDAEEFEAAANPTTGYYYIEVVLDAQGNWRWRAEAENPINVPWAAGEQVLQVERSGFD